MRGFSFMLLAVAASVIFSVSVCSCRTLYKTEYVERTDTQYVYRERVDSVLIETHDSTAQDVRQSGDTIFITKYKQRTDVKYIVKIHNDTIVDLKTEYVDREVVVEKRYIPKWCYVCLAIAVAFTLITIYRIYKWLR